MLDSVDRAIIALLEQDGKMTFKEIAGHLNLTTTPVYDRIKRLEKQGVIQGYRAVVDRKALGKMLMVFCSITLKEHKQEYLSRFESKVSKLEGVEECHHLAGTYDYLLKVAVEDMEVYRDFVSNKLAAMGNIGRVESSFVMTEVVV